MTNLKINTESAVVAAGQIRSINNQIRDGFAKVQDSMTMLEREWEGPVATNSIGVFREIRSRYPEARYSVLNNFVIFLLKQVGEGYVQTEEANNSLADAFK